MNADNWQDRAIDTGKAIEHGMIVSRQLINDMWREIVRLNEDRAALKLRVEDLRRELTELRLDNAAKEAAAAPSNPAPIFTEWSDWRPLGPAFLARSPERGVSSVVHRLPDDRWQWELFDSRTPRVGQEPVISGITGTSEHATILVESAALKYLAGKEARDAENAD